MATALRDSKQRLRKVKGHRHWPRLSEALRRDLKIEKAVTKKAVAKKAVAKKAAATKTTKTGSKGDSRSPAAKSGAKRPTSTVSAKATTGDKAASRGVDDVEELAPPAVGLTVADQPLPLDLRLLSLDRGTCGGEDTEQESDG